MVPGLAAAGLAAYLAVLAAVAWIAGRRISTASDYLVAGRNLGTPLAATGLLATWFGAGTLLASADEVRHTGLAAAALEPVGPGICLLLVGLFYAAPLRRMRLLTLSDFFRRRFGPAAEVLSAAIMVVSFFGWIAAQFAVLGVLVGEVLNVAPGVGLACGAVVAIGYTLVGGMWSVTLTDAVQLGIVVIGLAAVGASALAELGGGSLAAGFVRLTGETPPELLAAVPSRGPELAAWTGLLLAGALGNIPGQDVMQRVFAARSEAVARRACLISGAAYLVLGAIPVGIGLVAALLLPAAEGDTFAALGRILFGPLASFGLILVVVSAVLSSLDSALVSAASVLAQNLLRHRFPRVGGLALARFGVVLVGVTGVLLASRGASAYALLQDAYELTLAGLFAPLTAGLFGKRGGPMAAIGAMTAGVATWTGQFAFPGLAAAGFPGAVGMVAASGAGYLAGAALDRRR